MPVCRVYCMSGSPGLVLGCFLLGLCVCMHHSLWLVSRVGVCVLGGGLVVLGGGLVVLVVSCIFLVLTDKNFTNFDLVWLLLFVGVCVCVRVHLCACACTSDPVQGKPCQAKPVFACSGVATSGQPHQSSSCAFAFAERRLVELDMLMFVCQTIQLMRIF